eukprot:Sspe_Gene.60590::Locus_33432_Transcript_1_1_Confidence_1.000_Length_1902::g.60590::m.60590
MDGEKAKRPTRPWHERTVGISQNARTPDLLFFHPTAKERDDGGVSVRGYFDGVARCIPRLVEAWRKRAHTLDPKIPKYSSPKECPVCRRKGGTTGCVGCVPRPTLHRVVWTAAWYLHQMLRVREVKEEETDDMVSACLLLALKVQMPCHISWGVSRVIQVVTGYETSMEGDPVLLKHRQRVLHFELRVMHVLAMRLRQLLPMDYVASAVSAILPDPHATGDALVVHRHRCHVVRQWGYRIASEAFNTPLPVTTDPEELGCCAAWLAWRMTCKSEEEIDAAEEQVLTTLPISHRIPAECVESTEVYTIDTLVRLGLVSSGDVLYYGNAPCAAVVLVDGSVHFKDRSGVRHRSLEDLTPSLQESDDIFSLWRVRRGGYLFPLRKLMLGWPRLRRAEVLQGAVGVKEALPAAAWEVLYWMMWWWVRSQQWDLLRLLRFSSPEGRETHGGRMATVIAKHLAHDHGIEGILPFLPPPASTAPSDPLVVKLVCEPHASLAVVHSLPDAASSPVGAIRHGGVVAVIERSGDWLRVTDTGLVGWVFSPPTYDAVGFRPSTLLVVAGTIAPPVPTIATPPPAPQRALPPLKLKGACSLVQRKEARKRAAEAELQPAQVPPRQQGFP